jgi:hypothetical protein
LSEEKRSGVDGNDFEIWKTGPGINGKQVFSPLQHGKYRKILILPHARDNYFRDGSIFLLLPHAWEKVKIF